MNTDELKHKEITETILRGFYEVYNELGDGFLESVYESAFEAQLINYLKATNIEVGLLLNFSKKPEFKRFVYDNNRKNISGNQRKSVAK